MADLILPDNRLERPELFHHGRQPASNVKVNKNSLFGRDLALYMIGDRIIYGPQPSTNEANPDMSGGIGKGWRADGTVDHAISIADAPELIQTTSGFTWFCAYFKDANASSWARLFGRSANSGSAQPYANYGFELAPAGNQTQCNVLYGNTSGNEEDILVTVNSTGYNSVCGVIEGANLVRGYANGIDGGTATAGVGEVATNSNVVSGCYYPGDSTDCGSNILVRAAWRRAFTAEEILSLHENLYSPGLLIPL